MRRGTTPTIIITAAKCDLANLESIYITIKQGSTEITKTTDQIEIKDGKMQVYLDQKDTLLLKGGSAYIQMRAVTKSGVTIASKIKSLPVGDILKEGVIT